MSKERPKRNIIQKKYVSTNTSLPKLLTNAVRCIQVYLARLDENKLSSGTVKLTITQLVYYLGQICF